MQNPFRVLVVFLAVLTVGACSLPRGAAVQSEIIRGQNAANAPFSVVPVSRSNIYSLRKWPTTGWSGEYRWVNGASGPKTNVIRTGDSINLVIWDNQENSLLTSAEQKSVAIDNLLVGSDGNIFVPYINQVSVRGKTPDRARAQIAEQLELVVPSAQVQLVVQPGLDNSVDAVGGFSRPGTYLLVNRNVSILSLISQAGGVDPELENPLIRLIRGRANYQIRADSLYEQASANIVLRGGDKIVIEEDSRYFVALGATGSEQIVPFDRESISAIEALAMLGGLSDNNANPKGVLILREYNRDDVTIDKSGPDKRQIVFTIDLTTADGLFAAGKFPVNPKDLVVATESPINSVRTVFGLIGSVVGISNAVSN